MPAFGHSHSTSHSAPELRQPPEQHWIPLEAFRQSPVCLQTTAHGLGFESTPVQAGWHVACGPGILNVVLPSVLPALWLILVHSGPDRFAH